MRDIITPRLIISPMDSKDAEELARICNQPHVIARMPDWRMTATGARKTIAAFHIGTEINDPTRQGIAMGIRRRLDGALIGFMGVGPKYEIDYNVEIGYFLDAAEQGKGFATEAAREVSRYAFGTWGVPALRGIVATDNAPSAAVLKRCGYIYEKSVQFRLNGEIQKKDYDVYVLYTYHDENV